MITSKELYDGLGNVGALGVLIEGAPVCISCASRDEVGQADVDDLILLPCLEPGEVVWCSRCHRPMMTPYLES